MAAKPSGISGDNLGEIFFGEGWQGFLKETFKYADKHIHSYASELLVPRIFSQAKSGRKYEKRI